LAKEGLAINAQELDQFCKEKGFVKWFETSAKQNINIDTSTRFLISEVIIEISLLLSFRLFLLR
jgi:Ras-related protein Rab-32